MARPSRPIDLAARKTELHFQTNFHALGSSTAHQTTDDADKALGTQKSIAMRRNSFMLTTTLVKGLFIYSGSVIGDKIVFE